jgi:hypothetical protein
MQIRPKTRFTLLGVVGGWTRTFGVLHDGDTFLALETPIDLYLLARHSCHTNNPAHQRRVYQLGAVGGLAHYTTAYSSPILIEA